MEQDESIRQLRLLRDLSNSESFQIWRDQVVEPILAQLEAELANADALSEPVLRAKLKHYQSVKYMFKDVFEIAKSNLKESK